MNKLTVENIPTLAEEQLVADELEMFANSMQAFHRQQAHDKVFLRACADGQYRDVRRLLQAKADVNQCDEDGRAALHHAAGSDQHEIMELLLEHKASLEQCDNNGRQPLHVAVAKGHLASTKFLFGQNAPSQTVDKKKRNIFHLAALSGKVEMFEYVLENQSSVRSGEAFRQVTVVDEDHNTALHLASQRGHMAMITRVANEGLSLEAKNLYGKNPGDLAELNGHAEAAQWFRERDVFVLKLRQAQVDNRKLEKQLVVKSDHLAQLVDTFEVERMEWEKQRDSLRSTITALQKELQLTSQEPSRLRNALQQVQLASEKLIQAHNSDRAALMKRLKLYRGF